MPITPVTADTLQHIGPEAILAALLEKAIKEKKYGPEPEKFSEQWKVWAGPRCRIDPRVGTVRRLLKRKAAARCRLSR